MDLDGVTFRLWQWSSASESNQKSCVLQIEANGERLLLTGDIDTHAERALLDSPLAVPTDWLQSPHHAVAVLHPWHCSQPCNPKPC